MLTTANILNSVPVVLLGGGLIYWQMSSRTRTNKEEEEKLKCCTTRKEKEEVCIQETKTKSAHEKELDLSILPCIRQRRSVFPNEYDTARRDVSPAIIRSLLDAALWSPFHGKCAGNPHPAKFVVSESVLACERRSREKDYVLCINAVYLCFCRLRDCCLLVLFVVLLFYLTLLLLIVYRNCFALLSRISLVSLLLFFCSSFIALLSPLLSRTVCATLHFLKGTWTKINERDAKTHS